MTDSTNIHIIAIESTGLLVEYRLNRLPNAVAFEKLDDEWALHGAYADTEAFEDSENGMGERVGWNFAISLTGERLSQ